VLCRWRQCQRCDEGGRRRARCHHPSAPLASGGLEQRLGQLQEAAAATGSHETQLLRPPGGRQRRCSCAGCGRAAAARAASHAAAVCVLSRPAMTENDKSITVLQVLQVLINQAPWYVKQRVKTVTELARHSSENTLSLPPRPTKTDKGIIRMDDT
jgi:hypothetical protein